MRVDLPAPFSPTIAWTVPLSTVSAMSLLAMTPGKRFVMPSSRTAGAPWWTAFGGSLGSPPVTGSLVTMTHTPHAGPPRRGRRSRIEPALANLTRHAVRGGALGEDATARTTHTRRPGRPAGRPRRPLPSENQDDQDFGTVIAPEMIFCLSSSSLLLMSSM